MYFSSSISALGLSEHSEKTLRLMTENIIVYPNQFQVGDPTDRENHQYIYNYIYIYIWLVVSTPLKNMTSSVDTVSLFPIYGKSESSHVPKHQPVYVC